LIEMEGERITLGATFLGKTRLDSRWKCDVGILNIEKGNSPSRSHGLCPRHLGPLLTEFSSAVAS
jgi:hypothetical protein